MSIKRSRPADMEYEFPTKFSKYDIYSMPKELDKLCQLFCDLEDAINFNKDLYHEIANEINNEVIIHADKKIYDLKVYKDKSSFNYEVKSILSLGLTNVFNSLLNINELAIPAIESALEIFNSTTNINLYNQFIDKLFTNQDQVMERIHERLVQNNRFNLLDNFNKLISSHPKFNNIEQNRAMHDHKGNNTKNSL